MLKPSQGMQWQIAQTKGRISAGIYAICIKTTILVWLIGTALIVWRRISTSLPQLHHVYFTQWVVGGLLDKIPFLNTRLNLYGKLPISHQWYAWRPALDWLNSPEVYHHSFPAYCWHFGRWVGLDLLGIWAVVIVASTLRARRDAELIRGMELLSARHFRARLHGRWLARLYPRIRGTHARGMLIGGMEIPTKLEPQGFLITGSTGSGKTTVKRHMLYEVQERRQPAVILDSDAEFVQEFYSEERGDVILNPLDARCPFWSPWLELKDTCFDIDAENLAASFIREQPPTTRDNPFFKDSSRSLFEAILRYLHEKYGNDASSTDITTFLALDRKDIADALPWFPNMDPDAHDQGSGIVSTCFNAVKPLRHLPSREQTSRTWSAQKWARNPQGWIFLTSEANSRIATQKLQGVWLDLLTRCLRSNEIGFERVWIFADEFASFGRQPELVDVATGGRKRGISLVLGFQNVSQLRDIYGRDTAITLVSSPTTKIILRCDEPETAKWASDLIGNREITRPQMTSLAGVSGMREGINITSHRSTEPTVMPAQIQLLKELHGYLCIAGYPRCELTIGERHLEKRVTAFVPRSAATTTTSVISD
jgi:hypothetical protein